MHDSCAWSTLLFIYNTLPIVMKYWLKLYPLYIHSFNRNMESSFNIPYRSGRHIGWSFICKTSPYTALDHYFTHQPILLLALHLHQPILYVLGIISLLTANSCHSFTRKTSINAETFVYQPIHARPGSFHHQPIPLQRTNSENWKQIFPGKELRGHSPDFHIHVSVSDLYITTNDLPFLLQEICGPILRI